MALEIALLHVATHEKVSEPMGVPRVSVTSSVENLEQVHDAHQNGAVSVIVPLHGKNVVSIKIIEVLK